MPPDSASPLITEHHHSQSFSFHGTGSEYFRIWIVNLLLSIITFGIYSAWAKVRRTRYFYNSTSVAGSNFEYHGNPMAILKGRIIAFSLIAFYNLAFDISGLLSLLMIVAVMAAAPWLIWKSLQFKLYNSSYRGIRFGFRGSLPDVYRVYLLWPLLSVCSAMLLAPLTHQRMKKFQHEESRFGSTHFSFHATVGRFYLAYLTMFAIWLTGIVVMSLTLGGSTLTVFADERSSMSDPIAVTAFFTFMLSLYAWLFVLFPLFTTLLQNLIWNNTCLGPHRFTSDMKWPRMVFIAVTNIVAIICTLGLFTPFAHIRALKYRLECMTLLPAGSLDEFVADTQIKASATGEGMTDLLDFDLSL